MFKKMTGHPRLICPSCGHLLLNAGDKTIKRNTHLEVAIDDVDYDYFILCEKCNTYIGLKQEHQKVISFPVIGTVS